MLTRQDKNKNIDEVASKKNSTKEIFQTLKNIDNEKTQRSSFSSYAPNCKTLLKMLFIFSEFVLSNAENQENNILQNITLPSGPSPTKPNYNNGGMIALFFLIGICGLFECFTLSALSGVSPRSFGTYILNFLFGRGPDNFSKPTLVDKGPPELADLKTGLFKPAIEIKTSPHEQDEMVEQSAFHP